MKIDKRYDKPIHEQLEEIIIERISKGELKPNDKIESENSVARTYGISRSTVRAVYDRLVLKHILTRRPGKGTFISLPGTDTDVSLLMGFTKTMQDRGIKINTQLLSRQVTKPDKFIMEKLELKPDSHVIEIRRIRYLQETPYVMHIAYLPAEQCQAIMDADLENIGLTSYIEEILWIEIRKAKQTILASVAGPQEAALLKVKQGDPLLVVTGISYQFNERPIRYSISTYRADIARLHATSQKPMRNINA